MVPFWWWAGGQLVCLVIFLYLCCVHHESTNICHHLFHGDQTTRESQYKFVHKDDMKLSMEVDEGDERARFTLGQRVSFT
jgi:hypothetical protein